MAIHDVGYRAWEGTLASPWTRWTVITKAGVHRAWQSTWLKRMMLFAWLPAIWFAVGFFLWEQSLLNQDIQGGMEMFLDDELSKLDLKGFSAGFQIEDERVARHSVWSWLLYFFFRYMQGGIMVLMVGIIAPPLISQDVRSRAFLQYFSRPIARWQYALGKLATVWFYLLMISAAPALLLYALGVLMSPSIQVIVDTWDLPLRIVAASAVLMIPTASLALCFSSLTEESRYAAFTWFAVWILGWFTYAVMISVEHRHSNQPRSELFEKWSPVSLYHTLGEVQSWIFGFATFEQIETAAITLVGITVLSTLVMFRRISAPLRA
ncbi:ABC transporter permease [Bythopirellula polymerisocia]|uniref:ABC-2 family transporter protein n=1 Tax=Bythopirellula polymerisocia TaxID=2528003 RepID=A0A5C6CI35_9BACT|nr:ABC transporter permease subunit [Bythopirellula polymerisocia]TWU24483.1 ABC-2 family transporter protein [Bythopirellula polymerisocia]